MNSASQFHSDQFSLIEDHASLRTDDLQELFEKEIRTLRRFARVEESNHNGAASTSEHGTYGTHSQGEFGSSCGSLLD